MSLITKELTLAGGTNAPGSTPVQLLASSLTLQRRVFLRADSSIYINTANSNSDGFRVSISGTGEIAFNLGIGDDLWAWCVANSTGTVSMLVTSVL